MNVDKEQAYLKGLVSRDKKILKEIYQSFRPRIVAYIKKNGGTEEDGHDLFQTGLEIIYHKGLDGNFELRSAFYTFLHAVCRNKWLDELKKRKKQDEIQNYYEGFDEQAEAEEHQVEWERFQLYEEKFAELGSNCKKILAGFYQQGLSHKEIAAQMGWDEKYSRLSKHRCLERLKALIMEDNRFKVLKNISGK